MVIRFLRWLIKLIGLKTLFSISLLLMAVSSAAFGLGDVIKGLESGLLFRLVFLAIIASWFLARTQIRAWLAAIVLLVFGIVYLIISLGHLFGPLVAFIRGFLGWLGLAETK
jgi:hypothetical protein